MLLSYYSSTARVGSSLLCAHLCISNIASQSGGDYDLRPTATTNDKSLSDDIVIISLGARYKFYCANIARTFFVDPVCHAIIPGNMAPYVQVPKVERTYSIMLELRRECLEHMLAGQRMGGVAEAASKFLSQKDPHMLDYLPKVTRLS